MIISQQILKLQRETNSITLNPILSSIDHKTIEEFEEKALSNEDYKRKLKDIANNLNGLNLEYDKKYQNIFNSYNELVVFEMLSKKVNIEILKEEKKTKTPDYKMSLGSVSIFSDLKTLHFANGNNNYIEIQKDSFESKIKLEERINTHKDIVYFSDPISISPFKKRDYESCNIKNVIEELISKITNQYNSKQINYKNKNGLLLIDATQLLGYLSLEEGLPIKKGFQYGELNSGILWNVVFGTINDPTYNWIEFEGKPNIGKRLEKNGVLNDDSLKSLKAVAIITGVKEKKIIGFHRTNENDKGLLKILNTICDFVNDEVNSRFWEIKNIN